MGAPTSRDNKGRTPQCKRLEPHLAACGDEWPQTAAESISINRRPPKCGKLLLDLVTLLPVLCARIFIITTLVRSRIRSRGQSYRRRRWRRGRRLRLLFRRLT